MSNIVLVDDNNFEQEVLKNDIPVLVDFGACWCAPCARQEPILEKFAQENIGKIKVCKVNIDESNITTKNYNIHSVPTLMVFKNGKTTNSKSGLSTLLQIQLLLQ